MNLYELSFSQNSMCLLQGGVVSYLIAEDDEEIYKWMTSKNNDIKITVVGDMLTMPIHYKIGGNKYSFGKNASFYNSMTDYSKKLDTTSGITTYKWEVIKEDIDIEEVLFALISANVYYHVILGGVQ